MKTLETNPKYNGAHPCPECGTKSHWTCVAENPITIRVDCEGGCGTFERSFSAIEELPFFNCDSQRTGKSSKLSA